MGRWKITANAIREVIIGRHSSTTQLFAMVLFAAGTTACWAQAINQEAGQSVQGMVQSGSVDRAVHADATDPKSVQAGSRSQSQTPASTWTPTPNAAAPAQASFGATNSRTSQGMAERTASKPPMSPVWSTSDRLATDEKSADVRAQDSPRTARRRAGGQNATSSRFAASLGHVGGSSPAAGIGRVHRSSGGSSKKHLPPASGLRASKVRQLGSTRTRGTGRVGKTKY